MERKWIWLFVLTCFVSIHAAPVQATVLEAAPYSKPAPQPTFKDNFQYIIAERIQSITNGDEVETLRMAMTTLGYTKKDEAWKELDRKEADLKLDQTILFGRVYPFNESVMRYYNLFYEVARNPKATKSDVAMLKGQLGIVQKNYRTVAKKVDENTRSAMYRSVQLIALFTKAADSTQQDLRYIIADARKYNEPDVLTNLRMLVKDTTYRASLARQIAQMKMQWFAKEEENRLGRLYAQSIIAIDAIERLERQFDATGTIDATLWLNGLIALQASDVDIQEQWAPRLVQLEIRYMTKRYS
ncbi:MAG: hypothetical protein ACRC5C_03975 [Bacilli bacterium]